VHEQVKRSLKTSLEQSPGGHGDVSDWTFRFVV